MKGAMHVAVLAAVFNAQATTGNPTVVDPFRLNSLKTAAARDHVSAALVRGGTPELGVYPLAGEVPVMAPGTRATDLYVGLQASGNGFWSYGQQVYWALDDGRMGPAAVSAGGGHVTAYQFAFGVHSDAPGDTVQPFVVVTLYNAPPDPVADATNPVVEPPSPVSMLGWLFNPITLPAEGNYAILSPLIDLAAQGLDFDLDSTFYVEILPLEWDASPPAGPVFDPDVHAEFTGPGAVTCGVNQDRMWSDVFVFNPNLSFGDRDGLYDHPAEMDTGGASPFLNQSPLRLVGLECTGPYKLELGINEPDDVCVRPGEPVTLTLSQSCLPGLVRGYQAFLQHEPPRLGFNAGVYVTPMPYGLPIIVPIASNGGDIDLAAGIDDGAFQVPTSASGDLAVLTFVAGSTEGLTQVVFRTHNPPTRFSDPFGQPVVPTLVDSPAICVDGTAPSIICPSDLLLACATGVPTAATDLTEFESQGGVAADSGCGPTVVLTHVGDVTGGEGCTDDPYVVERTYRATDCAGNFAECTQTITVADDVDPSIDGCPDDISQTADSGLCSAVVSWTPPTAADNCLLESLTSTHAPGDVFPVGTTTVTYTAVDACGNETECSFSITVTDDEDPSLSCPADIGVEADAGGCVAEVSWPAAVAQDNCDGDLSAGVLYDLDLGNDGSVDVTGQAATSYVFPAGTHKVTARATDAAGNTGTCSFLVVVSSANSLLVSVELKGVYEATLTRCITFELWECPGTVPAATVSQELTFLAGTASNVLVPVPCGNYTCITARDALHTLRRTDLDNFVIAGTLYTADFTDRTAIPGGDDDSLIGGNLNDDIYIDILDFGTFTSQWNFNYGTGDTACATAAPHSDVSGDGLVFTGDFTFIQTNFLQFSDPNCCGAANLLLAPLGHEGPVTRISVADLGRRGLWQLAPADLNGDGWLDADDVTAFQQGARPASAGGAVQPAPGNVQMSRQAQSVGGPRAR